MVDLVTWENNTATILLAQLPLQSLDSALTYVAAYLSDVGGWIPNDPLQPLGNGAPANNFTPQQAADAITTQQFGDVYDLNFNVQITLNVQMAAKLGAGLSLPAATTAMTSMVENFVIDSINNSTLPLFVTTANSAASVGGASDLGGQTTALIRQGIAADLAGVDKLVDYKAISLKHARDTNGIDDTWNVKSVYREVNSPLAVIIAKYTNSTTWTTLDGGTTRIYVFFVSPDTYEIVSGVILD